MRWPITASVALLVVLGLFLLMQGLIAPPEDPGIAPRQVEAIEVVRVQPETEQPETPEPLEPPPPPPPAAPQALETTLPTVNLPTVPSPDPNVNVRIPMSISAGSSLFGSGAFAGFGGGSGAGGYGTGQGFKGKELIPLSTARPQITEWAYKQGIEGWVEVVFTVMPNGRVRDIKIVDAQPKGVFEAAAVESISNWIYAEHPRARIVKQRVEFKLEDYQYNWR